MTTLAEEMKAHALEAQRFSRKHLVLELDYSEASIQLLNTHADSVEYAIRGGKSLENIEMLTRVWGAYLGEALRKATGAEWTLEGAGQVRRPALKGPGGVVHPHEQVHKRLQGDKSVDLLIFFQRSREQLGPA
jgi:hypothetical protein